MVPHPGSILTIVELQRLELLRLAQREQLASIAVSQTSSSTVMARLSRLVATFAPKMPADLSLRPRLRIWTMS